MGWTLFQGDTLVVKQVTIVNSDGSTKDCTGLSVTMKVYDSQFNEVLSKALSWSDQVLGVAQWTVASADVSSFAVGTTYNVVAILTATGYIEHTEPWTVDYVQAAQ